MKLNVFISLVVLQLYQLFGLAKGHGSLLNPASRSSRWRFDITAPANYDDMSNFCGGLNVMLNGHGGKCGLCGDSYGDPTPRDNELGGKYGQGVVVQTYSKGSHNVFFFNITAVHQGYVYFEICNLDSAGSESEECFAKYRLNYADGSDKYPIDRWGQHNPTVVLPHDLACDHCVLRWTYRAGNNVNLCDDGTEHLGCGPQETFKNCGDIRITA